MSEATYNDLVRELFLTAEPAPGRAMAGRWVQAEAGSIALGTWVQLKLQIQDARVTDARFRVYGCPHTVAATAWLAQQLRGRSVALLLPEGIAELCRPLEVPVEKLGRLLLIEDAVRACERQAPSV